MTKYHSYSDLYFDVISFEPNVGVHLYMQERNMFPVNVYVSIFSCLFYVVYVIFLL